MVARCLRKKKRVRDTQCERLWQKVIDLWMHFLFLRVSFFLSTFQPWHSHLYSVDARVHKIHTRHIYLV